ncbi:tetratricopeptide repeat protein [Kaarinaea lacus]
MRREWVRLCCTMLLFLTLPAGAFDGDYVLEDRFNAQLAKAKAGDARAQYAVADMYRKGRGTVASDKDALQWYVRAARQGIRRAAYKAGFLYLHSESLEASPKKALPWLEMAADSGYSPAQYELGMLYTTGKAVKRNNKMALTLFSRAKLAGHKPSEAAFNRVVNQMVRSQSASR